MKLSYHHPALRHFIILFKKNKAAILIIRTAILMLLCPVTLLRSQWYIQPNPAGFNAIYDIQFTDSLTGWAVGENNTVIKTTDGGSNWILQNTGLLANRILFAFYAVNNFVIYAAGSNETIIKSTDGGTSWIVLSDTNAAGSSINYDVYFINSLTGWICSLAGRVLITSDGGMSWDTVSLNTGSSLNQVQFLDQNTGWIAGEAGLLRKTTDGGLNWLYMFPGTGADFSYNSMHFLNRNTGWIAGYRDKIFKTTSGGNSWDTLVLTSYSQSIRFADSLNGWCGGSETFTNEAVMCITHDGGSNWFRQSLPFTSGFCTSIWVYNDSVAWAAYAYRIIYTTNGGGPIGISANNENIPADFKLFQNYPNPFNSSTVIEYEIETAGNYSLDIYNLLGQKVSRPFYKHFERGRYKYTFIPGSLASGVYYYSLSGNGKSFTKKLILVK